MFTHVSSESQISAPGERTYLDVCTYELRISEHCLGRTAYLDEGDLRAKSGVHVGELQPDVATADDRNPVGNPLQLQCVI